MFRTLAEATGLSVATIHRLVAGDLTIDPATQQALEGIEFVDVPDRVTA